MTVIDERPPIDRPATKHHEATNHKQQVGVAIVKAPSGDVVRECGRIRPAGQPSRQTPCRINSNPNERYPQTQRHGPGRFREAAKEVENKGAINYGCERGCHAGFKRRYGKARYK